MKSTNDLWEEIGSLEDDEPLHVITKLFAMYDERLKRHAEDDEAILFFRNLSVAISETSQCNLNRR